MRKTYEEKILDLNQKAKAEILQMMQENGTNRIDLKGERVYAVSSPRKSGDTYRFYKVTHVEIVEGVGGCQVLQFNYKGGTWWYYNPVIWMDICIAVARKFGKRV